MATHGHGPLEVADIYAESADGLDVLPDVHEAAAWANDLVAEIEAAWAMLGSP